MSFHRKVFCGSRTPYTCHYLYISPRLECSAPSTFACARKIQERLAADHPLESETVRADHCERTLKNFCPGS